MHGKLRRDAGDEVCARAVGKVVEARIGKCLLDHAGAGRLAVRTGDEDDALSRFRSSHTNVKIAIYDSDEFPFPDNESDLTR